MKNRLGKDDGAFIDDLLLIVTESRHRAYFAVNTTQVMMNWLIGRRIVEQEQDGEDRAKYGKYVIKLASEWLTKEFGKGFSESNLRSFRKFYIEYKDFEIQQTLSAESQEVLEGTVSNILPWSHYERLIRVTNPEVRKWYEEEAKREMWTFRTLDRNISTQYYERMLMSQIKEDVRNEMIEKTTQNQNDKFAYVKSPTVLEFLGLPTNSAVTEPELESAILDNIKGVLMEMGRGFALVARQKLMRTEARDYYIDLVFYNYIIKCFFLVDLKIGRITHQDVGQMDMYVRMYDEFYRQSDDNPTIGIVLCVETDPAIARYSILKDNEQIFASKYQIILPSPQELQAEINRQTELIKMQLTKK